jgi:hypothetical protein
MRAPRLIGLLLCLCGLAACDQLIEAALCKDTSQKLCDKQFTCFPIAATATYQSRESCYAWWRTWCDSSEATTGCDINNDQLRACNDGIAASKCGQYPASCTALLSCK